MEKRLLALTFLLVSFVIFTSYLASAQEVATVDDGSALPQALSTGSGGLKKAVFLSETNQISNGSINNWVNAFNRQVTLTGTTPQCIEMRYSGEVKDVTIERPPFKMQFRATVDGVVAKGGAPYFDAPAPDNYTTVAMNWWVCGLTPGTHTVKIQFRPFYDVDTAYVRNRTLIIEYNQ